jgi:hypothetical protein
MTQAENTQHDLILEKPQNPTKLQAKQPQAKPKEKDPKAFDKTMMQLKALFDLIYRKEDVRNRLSSILDPENPQTSSKLSADQINFINDAFFLAKQWPQLYEPLKAYGDEVLLTMLSEKGYGVEKAIALCGAIEQSAAFKGLFGTVEPKKRRLFGFNRGESKQ